MGCQGALEVVRGRIARVEGALRLDDGLALLREPPPPGGYDAAVEVAFPGPEGFAGIAFAVRDAGWHELVYVSPGGEVQYDPVMNGSNTWQLYPQLRVQPAPAAGTRWRRLRLQVRRDGVAAFVDDAPRPSLVVRPLRAGTPEGRVGVWAHLPCLVRCLRVTPATGPLAGSPAPPAPPPAAVSAWRLPDGRALPAEPNGVLNLNRYLAYRPGATADLRAVIETASAADAILDLGYSDRLQLWLNGALTHEGIHRWDPPRTDGRVLPATAAVPVRLRAGANELLARLAVEEPFGWGLRLGVRHPS